MILQSGQQVDNRPAPAFDHAFKHQLGPMGASLLETHKWVPPRRRLSSPPRHAGDDGCLVASAIADVNAVDAVCRQRRFCCRCSAGCRLESSGWRLLSPPCRATVIVVRRNRNCVSPRQRLSSLSSCSSATHGRCRMKGQMCVYVAQGGGNWRFWGKPVVSN